MLRQFAKLFWRKSSKGSNPLASAMFDKCRNSLQQGAVGLARAMYEYQKLGYIVCVPIVDGQDYDLVVDIDGKFYTVQCRTTTKKQGPYYVASLVSTKTNCTGTKTHRGVYDLLFVMCGDGSCYSIPTHLLGKRSINLGPKYDVFRL